MSEFIFRFPADTPKLDYNGLSHYIHDRFGDRAGSGSIGTTVTITHRTRDREAGITFILYGTTIAVIRPGRAEFPFTTDAHMATAEWIGRIVRDNGIGGGVFRMRRRAADPLIPGPHGYVSPLLVDGNYDRPVNGYAYPAGQPGAEPWCNHDGPPASVSVTGAARCECGMYVPPESDYSKRKSAEQAAAEQVVRP